MNARDDLRDCFLSDSRERFEAAADALGAEVEAATRASVAADFEQFGKRKDFLSWGEGVLIAREGLCACRGGSKPCETAAKS
jgi:hypothetical protein